MFHYYLWNANGAAKQRPNIGEAKIGTTFGATIAQCATARHILSTTASYLSLTSLSFTLGMYSAAGQASRRLRCMVKLAVIMWNVLAVAVALPAHVQDYKCELCDAENTGEL